MKPANKEHSQPNAHLIKSYLRGSLSVEEIRYVEEKITEDDAWGDAIEGLKLLEKEIPSEKAELEIHQFLKKRLGKNTKYKLKAIQFPNWLTLAILVILLTMLTVVVLLQWL